MEYNALTSSSYAVCTIDNYVAGYMYAETNPSYTYPYVFKRGSTTVYVNKLPQDSGGNVYRGSSVMFSLNPNGSNPNTVESVTYTILGYGIATRQEAAAIGGVSTPSDSTRCVIVSELASLGCKLATGVGGNYTTN